MVLSKYINSFLDKPQWIFWYYVLINMVPSLCLMFTEPLNIAGKAILVIFPLGLYLVLFCLSKNTGLILLLLFPLLFLHAFQLVVFYLFGEDVIAADMFLNVKTTNATEAGELLSGIWPSVIIVCLLYLPPVYFAVRMCYRKIYLDRIFRRNFFFAGIVLLALSYGLSFFALNNNSGRYSYKHDVYPCNMLYNLDFAIKKWQRNTSYCETSGNFTFGAKKANHAGQREVYVMVVGETGRAGNWGLYGYHRQTTPKLDSDEGIVFYRDAITQSNTTHKSVPMMLSYSSAEDFNVIYGQKSIITAFKEVGFTTVFLSNQAPNHTFTDHFAAEADFTKYYRATNQQVNNLDEVMLPCLKHYIDSVPGNLFVVMHSYGSHFNYRERYPDYFSVFEPDDVKNIGKGEKEKMINAYDNSILYTDDLLHRIMSVLGDTTLCSAMFYAADHGEDLLDDGRMRFLHASPNPTYYQLHIPLMMWFSDNYKANYSRKVANAIVNAPKPVSTNAIFHTLLDMAGVQTDYYEPDLSLLSPLFKVRKRMYLDDHDEPIFFYNANLKRQDKEMIEKQKIYH